VMWYKNAGRKKNFLGWTHRTTKVREFLIPTCPPGRLTLPRTLSWVPTRPQAGRRRCCGTALRTVLSHGGRADPFPGGREGAATIAPLETVAVWVET